MFLHPTNGFIFEYNSPHRSDGRTAETHYLYHEDRNLQRIGYTEHPDNAVKTNWVPSLVQGGGVNTIRAA